VCVCPGVCVYVCMCACVCVCVCESVFVHVLYSVLVGMCTVEEAIVIPELVRLRLFEVNYHWDQERQQQETQTYLQVQNMSW
jgi:hypothetical protein